MNLNTALDCTVGYRKETHGIIVPLSGPKFGIHLIPFRTWEEYESYMRQEKLITESWLDLGAKVRNGTITEAQYHDKL